MISGRVLGRNNSAILCYGWRCKGLNTLLLVRTVGTATSSDSSSKDEWNSVISEFHSNSTVSNRFVVKDNIATKGRTTSASDILKDYESPFDATVVSLLQDLGFHMAGKANLDEFGMGSSNTNSVFGPVLNPLFKDDKYVAGGSSGGSAAAVAAGLCEVSLGTDTGGSVRLPASNCGVYGFKPSYGRLSRWGVIAYAQTLDTVGIMARDLESVRKVYKLLDKFDDKDPTSILNDTRSSIQTAIKARDDKRDGKYVIGIPEELLVEELSLEGKEKLEYTLNVLIELGHTIVPVSIPCIRKLLLSYYAIATAEAASNLSRYDGIVYGSSDTQYRGADNVIKGNRSDRLGSEVQRRIVLGNYTMSSSSGDHYAKATELREMLVEQFNSIFHLPNGLLSDNTTLNSPESCDFLISPTTVNRPITISDFLENEKKNLLASYTNDILTTPISLAGLPAISLPVPDKGQNISTQGIQLFGQYGDDEAVLQMGQTLMNNIM